MMINPRDFISQYKGVYAISDSSVYSISNAKVTSQQILQAGIKVLQYRDKDNDWRTRQTIAKTLLDCCRQAGALLIVNDDVDLAKKVDADGVHLGQKDDCIKTARTHLGEAKIIGATCHDQFTLAVQAEQMGADYVAFGRVFSSSSKPGGPYIKPKRIAAFKDQLHVPVVAIGGISLDNMQQFFDLNIDMLAMINTLYDSDDIAARCHAVVNEFSQLGVVS